MSIGLNAQILPTSSNHEDWIKKAIRLAEKAFSEGEVPVGAIVVKDNKIIGRGYNQRETLNDPTAHAEIIAITAASNTINDWRLNDCSIYVTKEPCPMCAGATIIGRVREVFYAFDDPKMGAMGGAISLHELPRSNHKPIVHQGILKEECLQLTQAFFQLRRQELYGKLE